MNRRHRCDYSVEIVTEDDAENFTSKKPSYADMLPIKYFWAHNVDNPRRAAWDFARALNRLHMRVFVVRLGLDYGTRCRICRIEEVR